MRQTRHLTTKFESSAFACNPKDGLFFLLLALLNMTDSDTDSEDKLDFRLLTRQLSRSPSSAASSIESSPNGEEAEVWPLHLTATFVEHYIIGESVGSGSYAEVRESINTHTLQRCVLKIINRNHLRRRAPRALANQLDEIRLLRRLKHVNVVEMTECLFIGAKVYIALEFCSFNLDELLREQCATNRNKLDVLIARDLFYQLCCGLNYLHAIGVVHRDIKPQNLLITNCGTLKIIDFGVSRLLSMWTQDDLCSNYEGSPLFQAPEVISSSQRYSGFKVDVWSAGVTLYLMLYGQYPFMDEALLGLYDKILGEKFVVPDEPPTQLALIDLLNKMLDKDHQSRASIEQLLQHCWLKLHSPLGKGEFFEFVASSSSASSQVKSGAGYVTSHMKDMYKSMSVLPYLYRHHFPNLPITKASKSSPSAYGERTLVLNEISPPPPPLLATTSESSSDSDSNQIEWGTREQYRLMKVLPIRANRVASRRR